MNRPSTRRRAPAGPARAAAPTSGLEIQRRDSPRRSKPAAAPAPASLRAGADTHFRLMILLELDAPGARLADADELCRALSRCGIEALAVARGADDDPVQPEESSAHTRAWRGWGTWLRWQREFAPHAWVRLGADGESRSAGPLGWSAPAPRLALSVAADAGPLWGLDARAASRHRLSLWDGEYVLSAVPLDERHGQRLFEAFAELAEEHPQLDLVALEEPRPSLVGLSDSLGIGARVHFAGPATRDAEWAWIEHSEAVVLAPADPVCPGPLMRCWARGRLPLIPRERRPRRLLLEQGMDAWLCDPDRGRWLEGLHAGLAAGADESLAGRLQHQAAPWTWTRVAHVIAAACGRDAHGADPARAAA